MRDVAMGTQCSRATKEGHTSIRGSARGFLDVNLWTGRLMSCCADFPRALVMVCGSEHADVAEFRHARSRRCGGWTRR